MKAKILSRIFLLVILIGFCAILSKSVELFFDTLNKDVKLLTPGLFSSVIFDYRTYIGFFQLTEFNKILWFLIVVAAIYMFFGFYDLKVHKSFAQKDDYGSHGTARWQTKREIRRNYMQDKLGWFYGDIKPSVY